jgi:hypothetical protein
MNRPLLDAFISQPSEDLTEKFLDEFASKSPEVRAAFLAKLHPLTVDEDYRALYQSLSEMHDYL